MMSSKDFLEGVACALRARGDAGLMTLDSLGEQNNWRSIDRDQRQSLIEEARVIIDDYNRGQGYRSNLKEKW